MESTTVVKALGLLEALATSGHEKSLAELALTTHMPKPTAHRLLKTLSATGYVERSNTGVYRPGPALERLAAKGGGDSLRAVAIPLLTQLHAETHETVNLGVLRQAEVVYLDVLESPQPLRRVVTANSTDPFYCTALGRAIVAHLPARQADFLLATTDKRKRTPSTVIDVKKLRAILRKVRRLGYATEVDQTDVGVTCLAAPIFDGRGVRAAISLSVPSSRVDQVRLDKWLKRLQQAAKQASKGLMSASDAAAHIVGED